MKTIHIFILESLKYHVISSDVTQEEFNEAVTTFQESIDILSSTMASLTPTFQSSIDELTQRITADGKLIADIQAQQEGLYDILII